MSSLKEAIHAPGVDPRSRWERITGWFKLLFKASEPMPPPCYPWSDRNTKWVSYIRKKCCYKNERIQVWNPDGRALDLSHVKGAARYCGTCLCPIKFNIEHEQVEV